MPKLNIKNILSLLRRNDHSKKVFDTQDLISFKKRFDIRLQNYTDIAYSEYTELTEDPVLNQILKYAISCINTRGKRIRPYLCFLAYCIEGGENEDIIFDVGIGLEIFHAFALIHDDIIDNAQERHGMMTVHAYIKTIIPKESKEGIAENMAMLIGDLLFSKANESIGKVKNVKVTDLYHRMSKETAIGQMIDVSLMLQKKVKREILTKKNELKTARYSFVHPMLIGATLANPNKFYEEFYTTLGLLLGQAFQIQDDVLDIIGNSKETGKDTMLDIQDGQHTTMTQYIFEKGSVRDQEVLASLFGKHVDEESRKILAKLFSNSGAIEYAQAEISKLISEAHALISSSDLKQTDKHTWKEFISILHNRTS